MKNQTDKQLAVQEEKVVTKATEKMILEKTPKQFVKRRVGRGGKALDYVETGYIINKLNQVFNYMWSFEVIEDKIGESQVYVKGKLTAHLPNGFEITKVQYGGSDIKKQSDKIFDKKTSSWVPNPNAGKPIDIGDDMKAASSDALKKCASLFGIAQDIFWPSGNELLEDSTEVTETPENKSYVDDSGLTHEPTPDASTTVTESNNGAVSSYADKSRGWLMVEVSQLIGNKKINMARAELNKKTDAELVEILQKAA